MDCALEPIVECTNTNFFASGIHNCCALGDAAHRLSRCHLFIHTLGGRRALLSCSHRQGQQQRCTEGNGSHHSKQRVVKVLEKKEAQQESSPCSATNKARRSSLQGHSSSTLSFNLPGLKMLVCISIELLQPSFELVHQFSFFDKAKLLQTSPFRTQTMARPRSLSQTT